VSTGLPASAGLAGSTELPITDQTRTAEPPGGSQPAVGTGPPVESVTAASYVTPADSPESDGTLAWDSTGMIVVTAHAGGEVGLGWSYGSPVSASLVSGLLADLVTGASAMDVPAAAQTMNRAVRNIGREGIASIAISAVDIALWDLKARLLAVPLATLLGQVRRDVPIYGSGGFITYDEKQTRDQLTGWVRRDRIPRVKIKIGESLAPARAGTASGSPSRARSSARTPNCTWTPTAATVRPGGAGRGVAERLLRHLVRGAGVEPEPGRPRARQVADHAGCRRGRV
jgi:mandelate racemase/muconate lactonizing enzyme-like protein